jgi:hypothetical protein
MTTRSIIIFAAAYISQGAGAVRKTGKKEMNQCYRNFLQSVAFSPNASFAKNKQFHDTSIEM